MTTETGKPVVLPGLLVKFLGQASVAFGCTRTKDRTPQIHWVSGWTLDPDGSTIHCSIPAKFSAGLDEALKDNGRFALTLERIGPHETYQFKGTAGSLRPASAAERANAEACRVRFADAVKGLSPRFAGQDLVGYILPPEVTVSLRVHEVFVQTPGPGAGSRLVPA